MDFRRIYVFFKKTMKSLDKVVINLSEFLLWPKLSCNTGFISIPKAILGWEETFPALELDFSAMGIMFLTPQHCLWGAAVFKILCNAISWAALCVVRQHWWWPLLRHWNLWGKHGAFSRIINNLISLKKRFLFIHPNYSLIFLFSPF